MSDWCILRTSGVTTLRLAASLRAAGIDAWSPSLIKQWRRPRSKATRDRAVAIVPSFVFASAGRISDLLAMAINPASPHPRFSLFRHAGRVPVVAEGEIAGMRAAEERAKRAMFKPYYKLPQRGASVRAKEGPWAGLEGVVADTEGNYAVVCFNGLTVKIASWLIDESEVKAA